MKLFAIYIGGEVAGGNIELHDMRFVVAERIEDTYDELRRQWWGIPESLHLDAWAEVTQADGYRITLKPEPSSDTKKLYYVFLGGYDPNEFNELHKHAFVVAERENKAKVQALKQVTHWQSFHRDNQYEAEQCFCLDKMVEGQRLYIHLEKIDDTSPPPFTCRYVKLGAE